MAARIADDEPAAPPRPLDEKEASFAGAGIEAMVVPQPELCEAGEWDELEREVRRLSRQVKVKATTKEQTALNEELWKACENGDLDAAALARGKGADPNWFNPWEPAGRGHQFACLHIASHKGHVALAKWLVEKAGADVNLQKIEKGRKDVPYGPTAMGHLEGRSFPGRDEIYSFLKLKTAALAVMAAVKLQTQLKRDEEVREARMRRLSRGK